MSFLFEKLTVYQKSRQFLKTTELLCRRLRGKVSGALLNQLIRAVASVPLNIAEGNGRWHKSEKRQFFRIARGSVFEVVPIIQLFHDLRLLNDEEYAEIYDALQTLSRMLSNLIKSIDMLSTG